MKHAGDQPFYEQIPRVKWDVATGYQVERRWEGRADILGFGFPQFTIGAQQAEFSSEGCKGTVVSRYGAAPFDGSTEQPTVSFSLRCEEISQSIFKHPSFSGLPMAVQKAITTEHGSGNTYDDSITRIGFLASKLQASIDAAIVAFDLLTAGDENYLVAQTYVLTMNRTASRLFNLPAVFFNDGKLFTTTQLGAYIGSTLPWAVPVFNNFATSEALRYVYGWRKRGSDFNYLPNGNSQLQEQWQSSRWSLRLYDPAS
jgi:hypothetical protein